MLIDVEPQWLFDILKENDLRQRARIDDLEEQLRSRSMKPLNDRAGATAEPIQVDMDRIHTQEGRLAAQTIMNRATQTYEFLNRETQ